MKVQNMTSPNGNPVPNQFIVEGADGKFFQSYNSVIAFKPASGASITLDSTYGITPALRQNTVTSLPA